MDTEYIAGIKLRDFHFDPDAMRAGMKKEMATA